MDSEELNAKILGLVGGDGWPISDIVLEEGAGVVTVRLECDVQALARGAGGKLHGFVARRWRHLDTCQYQTVVEVEVPRVRSPSGRTMEPEVSWAERFSRVTEPMEAHAVEALQAARSHGAAAELLGKGGRQLDRIMGRAVARGLARRGEEQISHAGIDEKVMRRGHRYVSVLTDIGRGRVVDLVEGRDKAVATDMWSAYMSAIAECLPGVEVVHDRFHVAKHLGEAVDAERKAEHRTLSASGDDTLEGTKYDWLRRWDDLRAAAASGFRAIYKLLLNTAKAWRYKEAFDAFWGYRSPAWARKFLDSRHRSVIRTDLGRMKKVAEMLKRHFPVLVAYTRHPITNGTAEGLNSKIQTIRADVRGLPKFETFRTRALFHCGKLDLSPA